MFDKIRKFIRNVVFYLRLTTYAPVLSFKHDPIINH